MSKERKDKYRNLKGKIKKEDVELFSVDASETYPLRYDGEWVDRKLARIADVSTGAIYKTQKLIEHSDADVLKLLREKNTDKKALALGAAY